jgi:hypothetical protein
MKEAASPPCQGRGREEDAMLQTRRAFTRPDEQTRRCTLPAGTGCEQRRAFPKQEGTCHSISPTSSTSMT